MGLLDDSLLVGESQGWRTLGWRTNLEVDCFLRNRVSPSLIIEICTHRIFCLAKFMILYPGWWFVLEMKRLEIRALQELMNWIDLWLTICGIGAQDLLEPLTSGGLEQSQVRVESLWDGDWWINGLIREFELFLTDMWHVLLNVSWFGQIFNVFCVFFL